VIPEILIVQNVDGNLAAIHHPDFVTEGEIDRGSSDLISLKGRDPNAPGIEFGEDRIAGQNGHGAGHGTVRLVAHPFFAIPTPLVIGHRGFAGECPENTLPSFERALAAGAAILETDLHVSRDGVPVLIHDSVVDRVCDSRGRVGDQSLAELQQLDAGHHFTLDGGRSHPFRGRGLRIPTFEEALKAFPGARFNVEIKAEEPGCVEAAVDVVVRNRRESLTLLTAGDDAIMQRLRRHIERHRVPVALGASIADIVAVLRSVEDGSAPATPSMALQIPLEFGGRPLVTRELIDHAHAHDIQIHVWTINDADGMDALLTLGVDGIVSDFPELLVERIGRGGADTVE